MTPAPGPDPDPAPFCDDPTHGEYCDCGARPDYEYESRIKERGR